MIDIDRMLPSPPLLLSSRVIIGQEEFAAFVESVDDELTLIAEIRLYWQVSTY